MRGGSWFGFARYCRSAYRDGSRPSRRFHDVGFRFAQVDQQAAAQRQPAESEEAKLARRSRIRRAASGTLAKVGDLLKRS